jgi:small-conductance mechanosensitive channel
MTDITVSKNRVDAQVRSQTALDVVGKATMTVMGGASAAIGLWAVASFVGGLLASGGPLGLVQGWFSAVIGV